jgi:hypothetical protein
MDFYTWLMENNHRDVGNKSWEDAIAMIRSIDKKTPWDDNSLEAFGDLEMEVVIDIMQQFYNKSPHVKFSVVPKQLLFSIWTYFGKNNLIRNTKGLEKIKNRLLKNIVVLHVGNLLSGHSQVCPWEFLSDQGYEEVEEWTDEQKNTFSAFLETENGLDIISDYGLPYLYPLFHKLHHAESPEDILYTCDMILNVVHQRSDMAEFFIEGGSQTLMEISNYIGD